MLRIPRITLLLASLLLPAHIMAQHPDTANTTKTLNTNLNPAPVSGWIMSAPDDQQRFFRIQTYLRGFDHTMWEVGERYEKLQQAVERNNSGLAQYHWKKIRKTILTGLMKRPKRAENAHALFLDQLWPQANKALKTADPKQMKQALQGIRSACIACHIAEDVAFVNNQPMFDAPPSVSSFDSNSRTGSVAAH